MRSALIATVFNEASSIHSWLEALAMQTAAPDEFIIVDGGSSDDTVQQIEKYPWPADFPKPRVIAERCNIAAGRNLAVRNCTAPILIATDAGSIAEPAWLEKMAAPFAHDEQLAVVGGRSVYLLRNAFQKRLAPYLGDAGPVTSETVMPSSRCIAFRRTAWKAVGGYPEWLTLTAEDALFNENLRAAGLRFHYEPEAVVAWEARPDLRSYLQMMYRYGYGSAEAGLGARQFQSWLVTALCPPLILLSRRPLRDVPFRYLRNLAGAAGWVAGRICGHRPPGGWKKVGGQLLSPETISHRLCDVKVSDSE